METLAFISYSRKDKNVANWLHSKLEKYPYPKDLVKTSFTLPDKKYLRPVFIDTKDLTINPHPFSENIKSALKSSHYLILICSKYAAKSIFVNKEVNFFLATHNNDYSKIVPLFINEVDDNIPPSIQNSSVMERHFPIYNTDLSEKSEANNYCFYQIAAYLLETDFSLIYNRYEHYAATKKKKRHLRISALILFLIFLVISLFSRIKAQKELITFEKKIFPRSVVTGYCANFLHPVISYMKEQNQSFKIYILMPTNQEEIKNQQKRINILKHSIIKDLDIDSLAFKKLPTSMKRGSVVTTICSSNNNYKSIYLDFASTTSSFLEVAKYKKRHTAYKGTAIDELVYEYTTTFIQETKEELQNDSVYVEFFISKKDLINKLKKHQN